MNIIDSLTPQGEPVPFDVVITHGASGHVTSDDPWFDGMHNSWFLEPGQSVRLQGTRWSEGDAFQVTEITKLL